VMLLAAAQRTHSRAFGVRTGPSDQPEPSVQ
jgi:hypothetical protein